MVVVIIMMTRVILGVKMLSHNHKIRPLKTTLNLTDRVGVTKNIHVDSHPHPNPYLK